MEIFSPPPLSAGAEEQLIYKPSEQLAVYKSGREPSPDPTMLTD